MIGKVGRFEILHRTVGSGLPYVQVVGSWANRDGAEALMETWFEETYHNYDRLWIGPVLVALDAVGESVAHTWVWENPEAGP